MIDAGLNDWQTMRSLNRSVQGNPQAEAALTRAVWDRAVKAAGPDTLVNADKLHKFNDNRRSALPDVMSAWRSTIAMIFMPFPRFVDPRLDEG